jgi:hypothetical protein
LRAREGAWPSIGMIENASESWFEGWQSSIGGRVTEFRKAVQKAVARRSRGGGAVGAIGLQVERDVQELANELGRGLMREAFEIANTTSSEVTACGDPWGFQRVYMGTYETTFGEVSVARSTYQQKGKGRALIPLDLRLGIVAGRYTPLVSRIASRALGSMSTNEGEALLKEIGVCVLSRPTLPGAFWSQRHCGPARAPRIGSGARSARYRRPHLAPKSRPTLPETSNDAPHSLRWRRPSRTRTAGPASAPPSSVSACRQPRAPLVLVDDLGGECDHALSALPDILVERHAENRPTWVTTGLTRE